MSNRQDKPKMSAADLVKKMRDEKGITFNLVSEADAERYLSDINNYFRTASYRKNYQKYQRGANQGKYMDLDFGYLQELAALDLAFRHAVTNVCLDIEHDLKITMLADIESSSEDGYDIVTRFLGQNPYTVNKLSGMISAPFTSDLMRQYFSISTTSSAGRYRIASYDDCPVWVLFEILSLGDLMRFYSFYYRARGIRHLSDSALNAVRNLRNGCAHNMCMFADLSPGKTFAPMEVTNFVAGIKGISASQRQKRLSSKPIAEFISLLYVYKELTGSQIEHGSMQSLLTLLFVRMKEHSDYYKNNDLLVRCYAFVVRLADELFPDLVSSIVSDN